MDNLEKKSTKQKETWLSLAYTYIYTITWFSIIMRFYIICFGV